MGVLKPTEFGAYNSLKLKLDIIQVNIDIDYRAKYYTYIEEEDEKKNCFLSL